MIAFEAATPFQVFNCINILTEHEKGKEADIYIYTYASKLFDLAEKIRKSGFFRKVIVLDEIPGKGRIDTVKWMSGKKKYRFMVNDQYEALYISYSGLPNLFLFNTLLMSSPMMKLYFYEDGISSYYNGIFKHSINIRLLARLFHIKDDSKYINKVLLYEPKLNAVKYKKTTVMKLIATQNPNIIDKIDRVFGVSKKTRSILDTERIIYFDHDYSKYVGKDFFFRFDQNVIVNKISQICGKIVVKISPLIDASQSKYQGEKIISSNFEKVPWEVLVAGDENIEKKVLITICSNAVITPKSIFDKEPYVIILGKAIFNEGLTNSTDIWTAEMGKYYNRIKALYRDKTRFLVPETFQEAYELIINIMKG